MLNRAEEEEGLSDDSKKLGPVRFGPKAHTLCAVDHTVQHNAHHAHLPTRALPGTHTCCCSALPQICLCTEKGRIAEEEHGLFSNDMMGSLYAVMSLLC